MRISTSWALALMGILLAGVTVDAVRAAPRATLTTALQPYLDTPSVARKIQSAVLLQATDCTGNLRMLSLLHRSAVRGQLTLAVIWYVGAASDSSSIRYLLPSWTRSIPIRQAPSSVLSELNQLGHHETPTLLVLDQQSRIRFASQSPRSPREFAGLQRIIEGLTWIEEL